MPETAAPVPPPLLSVVMVNWNTRDLMRDSLRSIYANTKMKSMEIIVVDNASCDDSVGVLEREFHEVIVSRSDRNLGFSKGCNVGIRMSRGRLILLINTDTLVHGPAIDEMVEFLEAHPEAGALGPKLVFGDGSLQRSAAGSFPSLWTAFNYFFFLANAFPHSRFFRGLFIGGLPEKAVEVDWVSSAVMLLRREVLDEIGLVPEDYVCFMEDVVCCQRVREHGWKVHFLPEVEVIHFTGGASKVHLKPAAHNAWRSVTIFFYKRFGLFQTILLQLIAVTGFGIRVAGYGLAAGLRRTPAMRTRLRRSINMFFMSFWLAWEIISGGDWQKDTLVSG